MTKFPNQKPGSFRDIERPSVSDFVSRKTRSIKADQADRVLNLPKPDRPSFKKSHFGKFTALALILLVISSIFVGVNAYLFRQDIIESLKIGLYDLRSITENFKPLGGSLSREGIAIPNQELETLNNFVAKFWPLLKDSLDVYSGFKNATLGVIVLMDQSAELLNLSTDFIFGQKGDELISNLETIKSTLDEVVEENALLASSASKVEDLSLPDLDFYLPLQLNLIRFQDFLNALIPWLKSEKEHHLLWVLQNPAIIRPTGGKIETYADITVRGGKILEIDLHDTSEIDEKLNARLIPPEPLQAITASFEVGDANWFFDFAESGGKLLELIEKSDFYKDRTFDGVIATTPKLVEDILSIIGPVKLSQENIEITSENFVSQIQKEDRENTPLRILKELTPLVFERMASLDPSEKQKFFEVFTSSKKARDFQVYFKDPGFQNFFNSYNISGRVFEILRGFYGDYLAVVNANIGGGKTDLFLNQKVTLKSLVGSDGLVSNRLLIERTHAGSGGRYSFYRVPNQNYLKIFTPPSSKFESAEGGMDKIIKPLINFEKNNYLPDPSIEKIEASKKEFLSYPAIKSFTEYGKIVFATWLRTNPGATDTFSLNYTHRLPGSPKENTHYQFVFENQPGASGEYLFEISAPVGFIWQESNSPVFEYKSSDPPARLILDLTLEGI